MPSRLLTRERADALVALPKRIVDPKEYRWCGQLLPSDDSAKRFRESVRAPLSIRFRLVSLETRDTFEIAGYSNGDFGYNLLYGGTGDGIRRIDSSPVHGYLDANLGEQVVLRGPHVHVFVEGRGLSHAEPADWYALDQPEEAFAAFLDYCNVIDRPWVQKALRLHD